MKTKRLESSLLIWLQTGWLVLSFGCGQRTALRMDAKMERPANNQQSVPSRPKNEQAQATGKPLVEPCELALAPISGETRLDKEIHRLQSLIPKGGANSPANLERLGWSFVQKARET